ncbi:hypothetical protein MOV73_003763 [Raoultella ornithinolytica]|uniref:hypothetical protein n=1 Tax=Raoultella ornithinolytica TaxID=54291 RepID=UPI002739F9FD|nr:hypothetical protein [Raoultella ornithinolytica]EKT9523052.1 hypothetical protein [Raoultella ornithinolytica]EKW7116218.1 hypothetical protein [Raoultella ornithinolytica]ELS0866499.1 hypothetical protein [Raoultella ornithinolytica]WLP19683.1 hypothetical protein Q8726_14685 [Raoultella ornithinolytica]HCL6646743.1 hypothetical protein [Raoultella ornithinolytica]
MAALNMTTDDAKKAGKQGLPWILSSILCGYATDWIPKVLPTGELQDWAYRSIPFFAIFLMFVIRSIKDLGSMSISQIVFCKFCADPAKKRLSTIINDPLASDENKKDAKKHYAEILDAEMAMNSRMVDYFTNWKFLHRQKADSSGQANGQTE